MFAFKLKKGADKGIYETGQHEDNTCSLEGIRYPLTQRERNLKLRLAAVERQLADANKMIAKMQDSYNLSLEILADGAENAAKIKKLTAELDRISEAWKSLQGLPKTARHS